AFSSSSLIRRASLIAQCTTMAPPSAASDHFTKGESKNDGIHGSDQIIDSETRWRRRHFRGGSRFAQVCRSQNVDTRKLLGFTTNGLNFAGLLLRCRNGHHHEWPAGLWRNHEPPCKKLGRFDPVRDRACAATAAAAAGRRSRCLAESARA